MVAWLPVVLPASLTKVLPISHANFIVNVVGICYSVCECVFVVAAAVVINKFLMFA